MIKQTAITILGAAALSVSAQAGEVMEATTPAPAQPSGIEYELAAGVHSEYIWRGVDQGGGTLVDTSFTAAKDFSGYAVSLNLWYATTGNGGVDEFDVTLGVEKEVFNGVTVGFGAIHYNFPDAAAANTTELYLGVSADLFAGVNGSFTYYKDVDANDDLDGYIELGLSRDLDFFGDAFTPSLEFVAGYDIEEEQFTHYQTTLSTSYTLGDEASVSPYISYSKGDHSPFDELIGGVSVAVSF